MTKISTKNGFAIIDKEAGWTSHDVVARARKILNTRKVGHSGTLDPPATGVLILGVGKATRLLRFITDLQKEYVATMIMGSETDTLDAEGKITKTTNTYPSLSDLQESARSFIGDIQQIPPMVSAVKVGGKRLYELAREGKQIDREPRNVKIDKIEVATSLEENVFKLEVSCGSGTYIRSLVADIAKETGSLAHVGKLRRTAIGSFEESLAGSIESAQLITMTEGLRDYQKIEVDLKLSERVKVGAVLKDNELGVEFGTGPWVVVNSQDELLAVYEEYGNEAVKPSVVIPSEL
tara:strand:- start:634 stop:1512 length:879 start_codon:yes stop_codon:yes gene_type:complete